MISCREAREGLEEYRRGELPPDAAAPIEAHLARCERCRAVQASDDALAALIRRLPREPAPPALRRRLARLAAGRRGPRGWLARPGVAALAAAAGVALALAPWVQLRRPPPPDPVETLLEGAVAEHTRILLQLQARPGEVTDPAAAFATVRSLTDVPLPWAFAGDPELTLVAARPTLVAKRKAAAVVLQDRARFTTTYFALPGRDLPMPQKGRVQIEQYRPYMQRIQGFHVIYWKQGDLAYVMVSNLDDPQSRQLFLKMRKAL